MKNVTPGGSQHPLAEELYSVILLLYKGQEEKQTCSEKAMLKACSDLLNNGIAEWQDRTPRRFADLDNGILKEAIWRLLDIETSEELKSHLLSTHLKVAVKRVCGGEYSQAIGAALMQIEHDLTNHSGISSSVWSAAMRFSATERKKILGIPCNDQQEQKKTYDDAQVVSRSSVAS